jgi:hypothetical protein
VMNATEIGTAFFTTPGAPPDRVETLRRAFDATMKDPEFLAEASKILGQIDPLSGFEMQKIINDVHALPADIIAKARDAVKPPGATN